ncbi:MAG: SprT family zinc-dependent metalloprotease [Bacteroidota bacterium]|nr:SprT family zinc-dependent metalloprotease [Bacteroidota bacterium]
MQKSQNILHYKGLGVVSYIRNNRARRLSIRINQQGEIRVTMPRLVSQRQAERFFLSKQQWVQKSLNSLNRRDCGQSLPPEGGSVQIRGKSYTVHLHHDDDTIEAVIWNMMQKEALLYLPGRVKELSEQFGYKITGLKIRKMRTRWGSCTPRKSINLNSWLVMLPEHLSDYVILHELVHTKFPDHSIRFWEELDRITGGQSKMLRKELRSQQIMCFPVATDQ